MALDTEIVIILDASGSMFATKNDTAGGLANFIEQQKAVEGKCKLTLAQFNDYNGLQYLIDRKNITEVEWNPDAYDPKAGTPLYDALGTVISKVNKSKAAHKILMIITDGQENSSKEYTKETATALISGLEKDGWEVLYLGAKQDSFAVGRGMGISVEGTANWDQTQRGTQILYSTISNSVAGVRGNLRPSAYLTDDEKEALVAT